nr:ATP-binding protein [Methylomarinum sp. Ch1-1]MDP4522126.1 ATP-binding protein [Methylomarinum sp. Ch1-1]
MPGSDSLTHQQKAASASQSKSSTLSLITLERAQKLDLLIHLISNLNQSLVVCGPQGIGKTKLLETLAEHNNERWPICLLNATSSLSFERIVEQFNVQLAKLDAQFSGTDLSANLSRYQKSNRKVVLIIDDAGRLVPGLVSSLIQYANAHGCLRLVLALTHDELHVKSSSDSLINDCHFIEIPPLSKKQCMTFLQNLSAQPGAAISFNAVTEVLVDNLYGETHGIPGRIVAELPRLSNYESKGAPSGAALRRCCLCC